MQAWFDSAWASLKNLAYSPTCLLSLLKIKLTIEVSIINNQVLRKIKIAVESDVKNCAYISLR